MLTCTLRSVYLDVLRAIGWDDQENGPSNRQRNELESLLNWRVRIAWEAEFWPEVMVVEEREYRETWDNTETYAADAEVYYESGDDKAYFKSLQAGNLNQTPDFDADTAWWEKVDSNDDFISHIAWEQEDENIIGGVDPNKHVFWADPRLNQYKNVVQDCRVINEGILVGHNPAPIQPWINYRPPAPEFTLLAWNPDETYAVGDLAYEEAQGECYKAVTANSNSIPSENTTDWTKVDFPEFMKQYVKWGVKADIERSDDAEGAADARAERELARLRAVKIEQTGNQRKAVYQARR